jgi:hypothetical protein
LQDQCLTLSVRKKLRLVAGAVECVEGGKAGRIRLKLIEDYTAATLKNFVAANTIAGTTVLTDGLSSYKGMKGRKHLPKTVGLMAAHVHPGLSRRVRVPLEPATPLPLVVRHAARHRPQDGAHGLLDADRQDVAKR